MTTQQIDAVIDLGSQPTDPVTVDGESTPFQNAGCTFSQVVQWLHHEGGAPGVIMDASDGQIGEVNDADEWGEEGPTICWQTEPSEPEIAASKVEAEITDQLSPEALEYWNGLDTTGEYIIEAQRNGIDTAVELVEAMAK
jgi:hypothetical protein